MRETYAGNVTGTSLWDDIKNAGEWLYNAADDVLDTVADIGDDLGDILDRLGFGGDDKPKDDVIQPLKPTTWPVWVWAAVGIAAIFIVPRLIKSFR